MQGVVSTASTNTTAIRPEGHFGPYCKAIPIEDAAIDSAWIHGLQQNAGNRSNLTLVNTGAVDASASDFEIDLYDGETGRLEATISNLNLPANGWRQLNQILLEYAPRVNQGYAHIHRLSGSNPFIAYGIINDGGVPGTMTDDGTYLEFFK
jgi:hypothetical protein